jgi:hypothetical protein
MRSASNASDRRGSLGPSPSGRSQLDARAELFAGADVQRTATYNASSSRQFDSVDVDQMDSRQVMDHALTQHRDTTASARRALQVCVSFLLVSAHHILRPRKKAPRVCRARPRRQSGALLGWSKQP